MSFPKWLIAGAALLPLAAVAQTLGPPNPADPQAPVPALPDASLFPRYHTAADVPGTPDTRWRQANRAVAAQGHAMDGSADPGDMSTMPGMQHHMQGMTHSAPAPMPHGATPPMPEMHGMHHSSPVTSVPGGHSHAGGH